MPVTKGARGKPAPKSVMEKRKAAEEEEMEIELMDEIHIKSEAEDVEDDSEGEKSEEQVESPPSRRRSSRTPKPIIKAKPKAVDNSDESEDDDDLFEEVKKSKKKSPAKKGKATGGRKAAGSKRPAVKLPAKKAKSKKAKVDEDEDFSGSEEEDEEDSAPKKKKGRGGGGGDKDDDDDENHSYGDFHSVDDGEDDPSKWKEPDYKDKEWFLENCLLCQFCKKKHEKTGDALECFHSHKNVLRCYLCFMVIKGGKDATKRLFKHYSVRHNDAGDKSTNIKCPHCDQTISYKSVSCHVISVHFREALGIPEKAPQAATNGKGKGKGGKKKSQNESDEEEEDEEVTSEEEEEEEEEEDDDESDSEKSK